MSRKKIGTICSINHALKKQKQALSLFPQEDIPNLFECKTIFTDLNSFVNSIGAKIQNGSSFVLNGLNQPKTLVDLCLNIISSEIIKKNISCPHLNSALSEQLLQKLVSQRAIRTNYLEILLHNEMINLDLANCHHLNDDGLKIIAELCSDLLKLNLRNCKKVTDEGMKHLLRATGYQGKDFFSSQPKAKLSHFINSQQSIKAGEKLEKEPEKEENKENEGEKTQEENIENEIKYIPRLISLSVMGTSVSFAMILKLTSHFPLRTLEARLDTHQKSELINLHPVLEVLSKKKKFYDKFKRL